MSHRILIVGMGSIGRRHLKNLQKLKVKELAVFDPIETQLPLSLALPRGGREKFDDYEDALCVFKPTIVFVCSPTNMHVSQALQAVQAGCHVFIEKPLSYSLEGIAELEKEAQARNLTSMVGCNMRFHPGPALVYQWIKEGGIGEVISARLVTGSPLPHWRPGSDYKKSYSASPEFGGVILDCIHEIDLALWMFGPADLLSAATLPARSIGLPDIDGTAELLLQHRSGVLSSLHLNFVQSTYERSCTVVGSRGVVTWNWDYANRNEVCLYGENGSLTRKISVPKQWDFNQVYIDEIKHFLDAVSKNMQSCSSVSDGCAALKIALAARQNFPPPCLSAVALAKAEGEGKGEGVKKFHISV